MAAIGLIPPAPSGAVTPPRASVQKTAGGSPVRVLAPTPEQARQAQAQQERKGSGQNRPAYLSCRKRLYNRRVIGALCKAGSRQWRRLA